jgi:hypothetical protein
LALGARQPQSGLTLFATGAGFPGESGNLFDKARNLAGILDTNFAGSNLPQGRDSFFVVALNKGIAAFLKLAHAAGGQHHHSKTVGNPVKTVLDRNTCHKLIPLYFLNPMNDQID